MQGKYLCCICEDEWKHYKTHALFLSYGMVNKLDFFFTLCSNTVSEIKRI